MALIEAVAATCGPATPVVIDPQNHEKKSLLPADAPPNPSALNESSKTIDTQMRSVKSRIIRPGARDFGPPVAEGRRREGGRSDRGAGVAHRPGGSVSRPTSPRISACPTGVAAVTNLVPARRPAFPPGERPSAGRTDLVGGPAPACRPAQFGAPSVGSRRLARNRSAVAVRPARSDSLIRDSPRTAGPSRGFARRVRSFRIRKLQ